MNILTYSAEKERLTHELRAAMSIIKSCVKRQRWEAAKQACDHLRYTVRQLELLEVQHGEELQ